TSGAPESNFSNNVSTAATVIQPNIVSSLTVSKSSVPIRSQYAVGGAESDAVARYTLKAGDEPEQVTEIYVTVGGNSQSIDRIDAFRPGDVNPAFSLTIGAVGNVPMPNGTFAAHLTAHQFDVG